MMFKKLPYGAINTVAVATVTVCLLAGCAGTVRKSSDLSATDHYNRAAAHLDKSEYDRIVAELNKAARLDPSLTADLSAADRYDRAAAHFDKGKYDSAIDELDKAIRLDSNLIIAHILRGISHFQKSDRVQAITDITQGVAAYGRLGARGDIFLLIFMYTFRGALHLDNGNFDQAVVDFMAALEMDRSNTFATFAKRGLETAQQRLSEQEPFHGRSKSSVQNTIIQGVSLMRYNYNKVLREKPGLDGRIVVRFAINEDGTVFFAEMVESTMNDPEFEEFVVEAVKKLDFGKIDKKGDITEIKYPFIFSR